MLWCNYRRSNGIRLYSNVLSLSRSYKSIFRLLQLSRNERREMRQKRVRSRFEYNINKSSDFSLCHTLLNIYSCANTILDFLEKSTLGFHLGIHISSGLRSKFSTRSSRTSAVHLRAATAHHPSSDAEPPRVRARFADPRNGRRPKIGRTDASRRSRVP